MLVNERTIFTHDIVMGLKRWHHVAEKRLVKKKSSPKTAAHTTTSMMRMEHSPQILDKNKFVLIVPTRMVKMTAKYFSQIFGKSKSISISHLIVEKQT